MNSKERKARNRGFRQGYNKAIDDFKKEMIRSSLTEREKEYIRYKAEQLKESEKKNDKTELQGTNSSC